MTDAPFARPKFLYFEATGVKSDGSEVTVRWRLEAATTQDSHLSIEMEHLLVDDDRLDVDRAYTVKAPTGEHNVKLEFTRCWAVDPGPSAEDALRERDVIVGWLRAQAREGSEAAADWADGDAKRSMTTAASTFATAADLIQEGAHHDGA